MAIDELWAEATAVGRVRDGLRVNWRARLPALSQGKSAMNGL